MENYLQLAHRSQRKAEYYSNNNKFIEAIIHLRKASEYLEKAIANTQSDIIHSSLIVQNQLCLDRIEYYGKYLLKHINQKQQSSRSKRNLTNLNKINNLITDDRANMATSSLSSSSSSSNLDLKGKDLKVNSNELYTLLDKQESILNSLLIDSSPPNTEQNSSNTANNASIINELKKMNQEMKKLFKNMLDCYEETVDELQALKKENQTLKKEITVLKTNSKSNSSISGGNNNNDNCLYPELPPLEQPTLLY